MGQQKAIGLGISASTMGREGMTAAARGRGQRWLVLDRSQGKAAIYRKKGDLMGP